MIDERKRAALTLALLTGGLALLCGWLLFDSLFSSIRGMRTGAPVVRVSSGDAAVAVLLPAMAGLAAWSGTEAFHRSAPAISRGKALVTLLLLSVPMALAAPWIYRAWAASFLTDRGYVRCDFTSRPTRFPFAVFARTPLLCGTADEHASAHAGIGVDPAAI
jgi:hypothetical protein